MEISMQDTRSHIYELQYYLRVIQIAMGERKLINPDGIYGEETREAVKQFQNQFGLPVTGKADKETWDKIYEEYIKAEEELAVAGSVRVYPLGIKEIKKGDTYEEIYVLQFLLRRNDIRHKGNSNVTYSGVYDTQTEDAVKELQRVFNLPQTGVLNKQLWNRLADYHNTKYLNE